MLYHMLPAGAGHANVRKFLAPVICPMYVHSYAGLILTMILIIYSYRYIGTPTEVVEMTLIH